MSEVKDFEFQNRESEFNQGTSEFLEQSEFHSEREKTEDKEEFYQKVQQEELFKESTRTQNQDISSLQNQVAGAQSAAPVVSAAMGTVVSGMAVCIVAAGISAYSGNGNSQETAEQVQRDTNYVIQKEAQDNGQTVEPEQQVKKEHAEKIRKNVEKAERVIQNGNVKKADDATETESGKSFETEKATAEEKVQIVKPEKPGTLPQFSVTSTGYAGIYDGEEHSGTITGCPEDAVITYGESPDSCNQNSIPSYQEAGNYQVYYQVKKDGYQTLRGSFVISIQKKQVAIPKQNICIGTYNGKEQQPDFLCNSDFVFEGTSSASDAGSYEIVLQLKDTKNCQWEDKTSELKKVTWTIAPRKLTIEWNAKKNYIYNGMKQGVYASLGNVVSGDFPEILLTGNTAKDAGSYTAFVNLKENSKNYTLPEKNRYDWSIQRKEISVSWGKDYFVYDGEAHTCDYTIEGLLLQDKELLTVTNQTAEDVGTYIAKAELKDSRNYYLASGSQKEWMIEQEEPIHIMYPMEVTGQCITGKIAGYSDQLSLESVAVEGLPNYYKVTYKSGNPEIIKVDPNGNLKLGKKGGSTEIHVTIHNIINKRQEDSFYDIKVNIINYISIDRHIELSSTYNAKEQSGTVLWNGKTGYQILVKESLGKIMVAKGSYTVTATLQPVDSSDKYTVYLWDSGTISREMPFEIK